MWFSCEPVLCAHIVHRQLRKFRLVSQFCAVPVRSSLCNSRCNSNFVTNSVFYHHQWIPCLVMLFAYYRIFLEANRQEKMLYKSQMIIPQHHHRNKKKQTKPAPNLQPAANNRQTTEPVQQPALPAATTPSQPNANNNSNQQVNLNNNDEEVAVPPASVEPKNSIPEITNGATVGHNGARLSNTSTTTTVTTLSTSTTTTATSGPATTSSSGAQQQQTTTAQLENAGKEETSLTRRKSSSITASMSAAALPNSQSMELKNSQINLSVQEKQPAHPQKPTSIDIQPANTAPVASGAHRNSHGDDTESGQSTPTKRNINKMRREHKAAKTLGEFPSDLLTVTCCSGIE